MVAAIGTGDAFAKGRDFSAWLGLVPKQISTGDRTILGSISKRGNRYLRALFVQAAWVVLVKIGPKHWERMGSSYGSGRQKSACTTTCWRLPSPTSSPASPGQFFTRDALSSASKPMRQRRNLPDPRAVLGPVKGGLAMPEHDARQARQPALTAPARGASAHPQAGTKERPPGTNKGTARSRSTETVDDVANTLTCRGLREDETTWRMVFPAHANTGDPNSPFEACPLRRSHAR